MESKHHEVLVKRKKYTWTTEEHVDGTLVRIYFGKEVKFERTEPKHIKVNKKRITDVLSGGFWYTILQDKTDSLVRDYYYQDYPTRLNRLWTLMNMDKSLAISEVREKLGVEETRENNLEIGKVIEDILQEESGDVDDDYDEDYDDED